jgi:hypothetical protein
MAIDGRDIARKPADGRPEPAPSATSLRKRDAYESPAIGLLSQALVWIPLALLVWFAYVSGTWMGGWTMGVISVVSTAFTVGALWLWYSMRRRRRGMR